MGLIGNRTILQRLPLSQVGGLLAADIRVLDNWHCKENDDPLSSIPSGYYAGGAWYLPQTSGGLSVYSGADGQGDLVQANIAGGLNAEANILGVGDIISAQAGLIVSAVATILGSSTFSASISGSLNAAATLAGQGSITAALGALASAVAQITGNSNVSATPFAEASMSAVIKSFGDLTPEGLAAAVWNSVAASFNAAGTMGSKLNSAGAASNPWDVVMESGMTYEDIMKLFSSVLLGKVSGAGTGTETFRDIADTKDRVIADVDSSGNRIDVTLDPS